MAIIKAFQEWEHYIIGAKHPITVYTDHRNLVQFTTTKVLNKRQIRWAEYLSQFDLRIIYRKLTRKPWLLTCSKEGKLKCVIV
jgi:hypothetical protein